MTRLVGFATSEDHPRLTEEDRAVAQALGARGIAVEPIVWSAAPPGALRHDLIVIRSCWDYHHRPDDFLDWLDAVSGRGIRVLNEPATVRRNAHKRYLLELAADGVAVVPTYLAGAGSSATLAEIAGTLGAIRVVIKPAVSASSFHTTLLGVSDPSSQSAFQSAVHARDMLVQPFIEAIPRGELSLIFLGGGFSHAVSKRAKEEDFRVQEEYGGRTQPFEPPASVIEQAHKILRMLDTRSLYARIDGIDAGGRFILTEAELIEPHLFLATSPGAVERFAEAIANLFQR